MKWFESWYISYALLGLTAAGMVSILLPLVSGWTNGAADIGLVMAPFSGGGLTAPMWGKLADRFRFHQQLLIRAFSGQLEGLLFSLLAYRFSNG